MRPINPKVGASGIGTGPAVILVWLFGLFAVDVPPEVAAALGSAISTMFGWFAREVLVDEFAALRGALPDVATTTPTPPAKQHAAKAPGNE